MKIYKFKCKDCGSRKYKKTDDHTYKCVYCGYAEEVYIDEQKSKDEQHSVTKTDDGNIAQNIPKNDFEKEYKEHMEKIQIQRKKFTRKLIAILLCTICGMTGIHRIYERKIFSGVIYLFTFGLFFIGWIYDILKLSFTLYDISMELNVLHRAGEEKFGSGVEFYE